MGKPQKYFFFFDDKTSVSSAVACEVCNRINRIAVKKKNDKSDKHRNAWDSLLKKRKMKLRPQGRMEE